MEIWNTITNSLFDAHGHLSQFWLWVCFGVAVVVLLAADLAYTMDLYCLRGCCAVVWRIRLA